jgi:hypothetical protein
MRKLLLCPLLILCLFVKATNYYVSPSGSDANNGTSTSSAWKTIAKINSSKFFPGDSIFFKRGSVWREQLTIQSSGSASSPVTFGAYGTGERPIINGADVITGWINDGGNVWHINSPNVSTTRAMVIIGGTIFSEVSSLAAVNSPDKYFIDVAASPVKLYVYSVVNPSSLTTEISKRDYGIILKGTDAVHHVVIKDLECRYAGSSGLAFLGVKEGDQFQGNCIVDNCNFYANRFYGCVAYNGYGFNTFKNSTATFNGNGFYSWVSDNVKILNCSTAHNIRYYKAPDNTDGHGYGAYKSNNFLVESCVSNDDNYGINIDAGDLPANAIIRYNKIFYSKISTSGIGVGRLAAGATIQLYYNLIVNPVYSALALYSNEGQVKIFNNSIYLDANSGSEETVTVYYGNSVDFKNNLIVRQGGDDKQLFGALYPKVLTADHNLYFHQNSMGEAFSDFYYNGTFYSTLEVWRTATNQDIHSMNKNPMFSDIKSDWRLQANSPCIDKGVNVGLKRDLLGNSIVGLPDIGAYEAPLYVPLPVHLNNFTVSGKDCNNTFIWTAENETDFNHYELEQSTDRSNFSTIYTIPAQKSNSISSYKVTLPSVGGTTYYRLKMIDNNGNFTYSSILSVENSCAANIKLLISPNPVSRQLNLAWHGIKENLNVDILIFNAGGAVLLRVSKTIPVGASSFHLDVGGLQNGTYWIKVINKAYNSIFESKFMKL